MLATIPEPEPLTTPDAEAPDDGLVAMWLYGKSPRTKRAYVRVINRLRAFTGKTFAKTTLADLQAYVETLDGKSTSVSTTCAIIKSFFSFANKLGALRFNVGGMLKVERPRETLPDRIMSEDDVVAMLDAATGRDALFLRFLYASAARISEATALRWSDFAEVDRAEATVVVFGKGNKTRVVRIDAGTWSALKTFRRDAAPDARVWSFGSAYARKRVGIIRKRAKLAKAISPHFFRHAHASHYVQAGGALDELQRRLGHASIATTGVYLSARPMENTARKLSVLNRPA